VYLALVMTVLLVLESTVSQRVKETSWSRVEQQSLRDLELSSVPNTQVYRENGRLHTILYFEFKNEIKHIWRRYKIFKIKSPNDLND
jgi:hypothetical protein